MEACGNNKEKALEMYKNQFNDVFKDRIGAVASMLTYIPVLVVSNKIYPKIAARLVGKNENKPTN